jgi:hypothetical protein
MSRRVLLATGLLAIGMCASLPAAPITGIFNIAGVITVTPTTITWSLDSAPFTPQKANVQVPAVLADGVTPNPLAAVAPPLSGTTVTIRNLNTGTEPVGVGFPAQPFISFDAAPSLPTLNINFIFAGIYSTAACATLPATVGQTCTPSQPGLPSPFNFVNNPPPAPDGPQATATFAMSGVTNDGLERWQGNFTSQFTVPYQQVLAQLAQTGSVTNTFSASITLTPAPQVPEAGTMSLLGLGLVAFSMKLRRRKQQQ